MLIDKINDFCSCLGVDYFEAELTLHQPEAFESLLDAAESQAQDSPLPDINWEFDALEPDYYDTKVFCSKSPCKNIIMTTRMFNGKDSSSWCIKIDNTTYRHKSRSCDVCHFEHVILDKETYPGHYTITTKEVTLPSGNKGTIHLWSRGKTVNNIVAPGMFMQAHFINAPWAYKLYEDTLVFMRNMYGLNGRILFGCKYQDEIMHDFCKTKEKEMNEYSAKKFEEIKQRKEKENNDYAIVSKTFINDV